MRDKSFDISSKASLKIPKCQNLLTFEFLIACQGYQEGLTYLIEMKSLYMIQYGSDLIIE